MRLFWILLTLMFVLSACGDLTYRYYTRINSDGTVYKRIIAEGDSSKVYGEPFSFDVDDGWVLKYDKKIDSESGDTLFLAIADKTFGSVDEVNDALYLKNDSTNKDNIKVELKSKFAWFFTFHDYSETYLQRFPFYHFSIDDYLTDDEYAYIILGDTSCVAMMTEDEVKKFDLNGEVKFWKFISASLGVEYSKLINRYAKENKQIPLNEEDTLFIIEIFESSIDDGPELEEICSLVDRRLGVSWVSEAFCNEYFAELERQIDDEVLFINETDYFADVEAPGLVYNTNAMSMDNNIAKWQFKRGSFAYKDYTLILKYRTINYWAFIVVAILVIIFVLSFIINRKT